MTRDLNSPSEYLIKANVTPKLRKPEKRLAHKNISNNIQANWKVKSTEESDENAMILIQDIIDYSVGVFRIKNVQIMTNALE